MALALPSLMVRLRRPGRSARSDDPPDPPDPVEALLADLRGGHRIERLARIAANRIFALEGSMLPVTHLAAVARRELRHPRKPVAACLDTLALASIAAQQSIGQRPHLSQLTAALLGWAGHSAQLPAGEGKTLALTLAACVHAIGGTPVHLVHRDDAITRRNAARMAPVFAALGIRTGVLAGGDDPQARRIAHAAEVCFATARELLFDSLEPPGALGTRPPAQTCALIDDIDTLLIDGAASPHRLNHPGQPVGSDEKDAGEGGVRNDGTGVPGDGAAITAQQLFRRYAVLGGASATLRPARAELAAIYAQSVVPIPSIYPDFRRDLGVTVLSGQVALAARLVERVRACRAARRPVLIVAEGAAASATCAAALAEADILPAARGSSGQPGAVTLSSESVATSGATGLEAGVDPIARAAGGLAVIAIGVGTTRRADLRLRDLCARQGHPGSIEWLVDATAPLRATVQRRLLTDTLLAWPLPQPLRRILVLLHRNQQERRATRARWRSARRVARSDHAMSRAIAGSDITICPFPDTHPLPDTSPLPATQPMPPAASPPGYRTP